MGLTNTPIQHQPTNQPANDFGTAPILVAAAELYDRLGQPWLYRWYAIAAVCLVRSGQLSEARLEALLADADARSRFPSALQAAAADAYLDQAELRKHLVAAHAIEWQEHFAASRQPRKARKPK